ncbi:MAG: VirB3 family type IV secretion system protein [Spirochaetales bacterium]
MSEEDYSRPVYVSLCEPVQFMGIGENAFMLIALVSVVLASSISWYLLTLGIIALIVARKLCKKEPFLIDFLIENINQTDFYKG